MRNLPLRSLALSTTEGGCRRWERCGLLKKLSASENREGVFVSEGVFNSPPCAFPSDASQVLAASSCGWRVLGAPAFERCDDKEPATMCTRRTPALRSFGIECGMVVCIERMAASDLFKGAQ